MKVLLVSHTCQSTSEGQPKAEWLARQGVDMLVLVPDRWLHYGEWRAADIPATTLARYQRGRVCWPWLGPAQFYLHWYAEMASLLRRFQPDVIDLWEEPWGLVSAQVCWLRDRLLPQARIVSETEQNINKHLPPPFESLRKYVLGRADYAVGRNAEALQVLRSKGFRGPAEVIPNAVDETVFYPQDPAAVRRAFNWTGFVAGYVGRFVAEKGLEDILQAMPQTVGVQVVFIGSGPLEPTMRAMARALGLEHRVQFLSGRPQAELATLMNGLDALILPSRTTARWKEQFGRVIIEAQACGLPVVGSDSGAIPEVLGDRGLIIAERNPTALAQALTTLSQDVALGRRLGEAGRKHVLQHCTWERVAGRFQSIYEKIARQDSPGRT